VQRGSATIYEAARVAGVSIATVSRVLNDRPGVNVKTRQRVLDACKKLGFSPNPVARQLTSGPDKTVGLLMAPRAVPGGLYFSLIHDDITDALDRRGLLARSMDSHEDGTPKSWVKGYVLLGTSDDDPRPARLRDAGRPFVVLGQLDAAFWASPDEVNGQARAVRHLAAMGRRRILHVTGHGNQRVPRARLEGYKKGLTEAGLPFDAGLVLDGDFTALQAYRALRRALAEGIAFDAAACASDDMAVGVIAALEDHGLRVPEDVAVVGFDGLPLYRDTLTSIRQDLQEIAEAAATLLEEAIAGAPARGVMVPVDLVVGPSTVKTEALPTPQIGVA
jgi:LacI family transcriptional regulator